MAINFEQSCPLCDELADYCWVDRGNVKYFDCPSCGMFQISRRAESLLLTELQTRKPSYAAMAHETPDGHLLLICMPPHEFRQQSGDRLQARFTPKAELDLTCQ